MSGMCERREEGARGEVAALLLALAGAPEARSLYARAARLLCAAEEEVNRERAKRRDWMRRAQKAEAAVEAGITKAGGPGVLGRGLANVAATMYKARAEEAEQALAREREFICSKCGFRVDPHICYRDAEPDF